MVNEEILKNAVVDSVCTNKIFCYWELEVCFVSYMRGTPESPLPLNPAQGSDLQGTVAATRSTSAVSGGCVKINK